jgi:serine/threonine protein kinase
LTGLVVCHVQLNLLSSLDHPNIVRYLGTSKEGNSLFIFLEYLPVS